MATRIVLVATLCLILAVCSWADETVTAATGHKTQLQTAWQFISGRQDLLESAYQIRVLGLQPFLDGRFSGTLLLPTDKAWEDYLSRFQSDQDRDLGYFQVFFGALLQYHMINRRITTKSVRSLVVNTQHVLEPPINNKVRYHQLTFVNSRSNKPPVTPKGSVTASHYYGATLDSIKDEQGNTVTFAATNIKVNGGGIIHIVNSVLQPSDIYPSFAALVEKNPDISIVADILANLTAIDRKACPTSPALDYYPYGPYGNCTWIDSWYRFNGTYLDYTPLPCYDPSSCRQPSNRRAEGDVVAQQNNKDFSSFEFTAGTMALPTDTAFTAYNEYPNQPEKWRRLVRYHFIWSGNNSRLLMNSSNGRWPSPNTRVTYLGERDLTPNRLWTQTYATDGGSALSIRFSPPSKSGRSTVKIDTNKGTNLQTPGKFYHKINEPMMPNIPNI